MIYFTVDVVGIVGRRESVRTIFTQKIVIAGIPIAELRHDWVTITRFKKNNTLFSKKITFF